MTTTTTTITTDKSKNPFTLALAWLIGISICMLRGAVGALPLALVVFLVAGANAAKWVLLVAGILFTITIALKAAKRAERS